MNRIEEWVYKFDGVYSPAGFVAKIHDGVKTNYGTVTLLEWWSIYDIDAKLEKIWLIKGWEYIAYVTDQVIIDKYKVNYNFLDTIGWDNLKTLEWFLYPDTYFVDLEQNVLDQLVKLQLNNFDQKIWQWYREEFKTHYKRTLSLGFVDENNVLDLNPYQLLVLASVVEKEERNDNNRPEIAWVFMNRLIRGERIDADITLCYGLKTWYENCSPTKIVEHLYDDTNIYNTRALKWLPPTPISSITIESMLAVLRYIKTDNIFYLHDNNGSIHFAKTISEHNDNKSKYLN